MIISTRSSFLATLMLALAFSMGCQSVLVSPPDEVPKDSIAIANPQIDETLLPPGLYVPDVEKPKEPAPDDKGPGWKPMFDGKTLKGWKESEFGGTDEVSVKDGTIVIRYGAADLAGITRTAPILKMNYEISLEAMRVDGSDFFCGLTFPYNDACATLIVGGWGGMVVGISSFDNQDAVENETTTSMEFKTGEWYRIHLQVTPTHIKAWINGKQMINTRPGNRKVDVRWEIEPAKPLGISTWNTTAAIRDIRVRDIAPQ